MSTKTKTAAKRNRASTKTSKLPVPPPKGANVSITDDPKKAGIPPALQTQNRKPLTPEEQARVDAAIKTNSHKAAPVKSETLQRMEAEEKAKRKTKREVAAEKKAAAASGATQKMPPTGKAAAAVIAGKPGKPTKAEKKVQERAAVAALKGNVAAAKNGSSYDWAKAEALASEGKTPPVPPFVSYGPHMKKLHDLTAKGEVKPAEDYLKGFKPGAPRENLRRYGSLCIAAANQRLVKR